MSSDHKSELSINAASSRGGHGATGTNANIGRRRNRHTAGLPGMDDLLMEEKGKQIANNDGTSMAHPSGAHQSGANADTSMAAESEEAGGSSIRMTRLRKR